MGKRTGRPIGRPRGFLQNPEKYQYDKNYLREVRYRQKKRAREEEAKILAEARNVNNMKQKHHDVNMCKYYFYFIHHY